ncbi:DsbA family protein [bacterium]|nr:DsbA family protein [bacterium]
MFLGGVMMATGNQPPATVPAKGVYSAGDIERNSVFFGYPVLSTPSNFFTEVAKSILQVQRIIVAAQLQGENIEPLISAFTDAIHSDKKKRDDRNELHINDKFLSACCLEAGFDSDALILASKQEHAKGVLKENTEEAVRMGVFGSPSYVVFGAREEYGGPSPFLIFGSDRFDLLAEALGIEWSGPNPSLSKL